MISGSGARILANGITDPTLERLVSYLGEKISSLCQKNEGNVDDSHVMTLIQKISMIGIIPVAHPILVRQYTITDQTKSWFTAYLWGTVFTSFQYLPIFDWTKIKMITLGLSSSK